MHKIIFFLIIMIGFILSGCGSDRGSVEEDNINATAIGSGTKGPFVKNSIVKAYQLNSNGSRTTKYVQTNTTDNLGNFSIPNISWTGATEIVISGNYFDENSGTTSTTPATLSVIINVSNGQNINANINVLTDLEASRIKSLMEAGYNISTAKAQAKQEIANSFDLNIPSNVGLEDLDPTKGSGDNVKANTELLRISTAIAKQPAILDSLEKAIEDGNITNDSNGSTAFANLSQAVNEVNLTQVSNYLEDNLSISDAPDADDTDQTASYATDTHAPVIQSNGAGETASISIAENSTEVTTVQANDSDNNSTLTYSISGGADQDKFDINSTTGILTFKNAPDFDNPTDLGGNNSYEVIVMVSDGMLVDTQTIIVTVTDVNEYDPTITNYDGNSTATITMQENNKTVTTITATDGDKSDTIIYSISGGEDKDLFDINSTTGVLTFKNAPDYDNPTDSNTDNSYVVEVKASDGTREDTQTLIINITKSNSGEVESSEDNATIQGDVIDAPVRGANVSVYSDAELQTLIGSGTTDNNGSFNFNLTVQTIPSTIYIKTTGGYNIDDGMPAPDMSFMGSAYSDGRYYITPLTNYVRQRVVGGEDFTTAKSNAVTYFSQTINGFDESDLFANPLTNPESNSTVNAIIQNGTIGVNLNDGNYSCVILNFSESDIGNTIGNIDSISTNNLKDFNITISNGQITGSTDGSDSVTGTISGSAMLMTILSPDAQNPTEIIKIAGTIGMLGSVSGTYTSLSTEDGNLTKGVFAGEFLPVNDINVTGFTSKVIDFASGTKNFLINEFIGEDNVVGFGNFVITSIKTTDFNISMTDMNITVEENTTSSSQIVLSASDAKLLTRNSTPTNLAIMSFNKPDGKIYAIQPIGLRKSIFVDINSSGNIVGIGNAIINKQGTFTPNLQANTNYQINVYSSGIWLLDESRDSLLSNFISLPLNTENISSQNLESAFDINLTLENNETKWIFSGGDIVIYKDDDGDDLSDLDNDFVRSFKILSNNAFYGEDISGGVINGISIKTFPTLFVGKIRPTATISSFPTYSGTLNFISRVLYTTQYNTDYATYNYGSIHISGNSASFQTHDGNFSLTADYNSTSGVYHLYGQPENSYFIDIIWPIGSPKAIFTQTYDSNNSIKSIGEAYLTE